MYNFWAGYVRENKQKSTSIFFCLFYLVYQPVSFGETLQSSSVEVYFYMFFLAIAKGSRHIAHTVLKSLWTADGYPGNALRSRRWYCGKYPLPLNITSSCFVANIAEERDYKSLKSWGLSGEGPFMFSFGLNYWPRLLNEEKKHFTKKSEERRWGERRRGEGEKMCEKRDGGKTDGNAKHPVLWKSLVLFVVLFWDEVPTHLPGLWLPGGFHKTWFVYFFFSVIHVLQWCMQAI